MEFLAGQNWIMTNFCGPRQYFFSNFLMEPAWWVSLSRFWLNYKHYFRNLKTVSSRHKYGDPLPQKTNSFVFLVYRQFLFPKKREFMREYSVFRNPCCLLMNFHPKKTDLVLASRALLGSIQLSLVNFLRLFLPKGQKSCQIICRVMWSTHPWA
jgi:hypothetical protein